MPNDSNLVSNKMMMIVTIIVSAVWGLSMMVSFINTKFSPPEGVNIAFGAVTGYLFNHQVRKD